MTYPHGIAHKGLPIDISDASPERLASGIRELLSGEPVCLHGVTINPWAKRVHIYVESQWLPANVTESRAKRDFDRARTVYRSLREQHPVLAERFDPFPATYELIHDSGKGSSLLCSLDGDRIIWA
jgi:hypothetical protein